MTSRAKTVISVVAVALIASLGLTSACLSRKLKGPTPHVIAEQRIIYSERNAPPEPAIKNIVYKRGILGSQALDIYMPTRVTTPPVPAVIFVHGGSWLHGSKDDIRVIDRFLGKMRRSGWAVISINYVAPAIGLLNAPENNVAAALDWIKKNAPEYGLDPNRLGLYSVSAGSHLVLAALNNQASPKSEWRFWLNEYGPANLLAMAKGEAFASTDRLALIPESYLRRHSPALFVDAPLPPTIIVHGDSDQTVALAQSVRLAERLEATGTDVTLRIIPGGDHGFFNLPQSEWIAMEDDFLPLMEEYFR